MPSSITHSYFIKDIYNRLNNKYKDLLKVNVEELKTYAQGPDILYFYNFFLNGNSKKIRDMGSIAHKYRTKLFFENLITYIVNHKLENNPEILSFLYGSIGHYNLDVIVHPFVNYLSYDKDNNKKIENKHTEIERFLDCYMIEKREGIKANIFKCYRECYNVKHISNELKNLISYVYKNTYNFEGVADAYLDSIKQYKLYFWLFRYDEFGIKKFFYNIIDSFTKTGTLKTKNFSYFIKVDNNSDYLNNKHNIWYNVRLTKNKYTYSFDELYNLALEKTITMIDDVNLVLEGKKDINYLDNIFRDLSYSNGLKCSTYKNKL